MPASRASRRRCSSSIPAGTRSSSRASGTRSTSSRHEAGRMTGRRRDRRRRDGRERGLSPRRAWASATWSSSTAPTAPGAGSTGRATGGYRAQYATPINVRLSLLAREKLRSLRGRDRRRPGLRSRRAISGSPRTPAELAVLRRGPARSSTRRGCVEAAAVDTRTRSRGSIPAIRLEGVVGGAFCPDRRIHPAARDSRGLPRAARRLGVRIEWGVEVTGFAARRDGRIAEVETSRGPIAVEAVVNAAGPWAAAVAEMAGVDAPGDAAPPPGRGHRALRSAARRHADDHLGRRRVSSPGARRTGAAALAHARRRRAAVRRVGGSGVGRRGRPPWRTPACRCSARPRSIAPRAGPACTRCRPTSTRFSARRPSARTFTSSTALPGTG